MGFYAKYGSSALSQAKQRSGLVRQPPSHRRSAATKLCADLYRTESLICKLLKSSPDVELLHSRSDDDSWESNHPKKNKPTQIAVSPRLPITPQVNLPRSRSAKWRAVCRIWKTRLPFVDNHFRPARSVVRKMGIAEGFTKAVLDGSRSDTSRFSRATTT